MPSDAERYVEQNEEQLTRLIKHSNNDFVRSLALAALIEFGDDATIESVADDLERLLNAQGGEE